MVPRVNGIEYREYTVIVHSNSVQRVIVHMSRDYTVLCKTIVFQYILFLRVFYILYTHFNNYAPYGILYLYYL